MRKLIKIISLLCLVCFSFFYTDRVINLINKRDPLMIEINNIKNEYEIVPVNAIIDNDTIVPGTKGRKVEIEKSYEEMRVGGVFREEELVYKDIYPSDTLSNNKNKYIISGNSSKNKVAILYILSSNNFDDIESISNITLFVNHKYLTTSNINKLKNKEIYSYGNNGIYNEEILTSDNTLINRISHNKSIYCMSKEKDKKVLDICNKKDMYVVVPNVVGDYLEIKNNLSNGSIILLNNLKNIDIITKYINSKGYDIVPLSKLLEE